MKAIAYKRIQREIFKRSKIAYYEKSKRFLRFVSLSSDSVANNLRLEYHVFRYQRFGRVGFCRNHCLISGRGHSVYRSFRLTRNMIRELAHSGQIYGLMKASWLQSLTKFPTDLKHST